MGRQQFPTLFARRGVFALLNYVVEKSQRRLLPHTLSTYLPPILSSIVFCDRCVCSRGVRFFVQGTLDTERKFAAGENKSSHRGHMNMKKLDDETEEFQREFCREMCGYYDGRAAVIVVASVQCC